VRDGIRYEFGMAVRSLKLALSAKTDVVEFHPPKWRKTRI
jgi:hypothetical protein